MFERPQVGERAILVHIDFGEGEADARIQELSELAMSAGAETVERVLATRHAPNAKFFIGSGKVEDILILIRHHDADLVIFNHILSPSQERNLEKHFECRVLGRSGLILDIFAQRAQSFEGKLQVELAQLHYLSTRLIRGWTHLERQKGGIGLRGPGETQLETDRRLIGDRIKQLKGKLAKVRNQRSQGRQARKKAEIPAISLVGYTNAGKSTLFNTLSQSDVYVQDQLFATLDPSLRKIQLPKYPTVILADTVGFIRDLPHDLIEAFRSTLQETVEADLLLHVIDCAHPEKDSMIAEVKQVLEAIGADNIPVLEVYNKIDQLEHASVRSDQDEQGVVQRVWVSASAGLGIDALLQAIEDRLPNEIVSTTLRIPFDQGHIRAALFREQCVTQETTNSAEMQWHFEVTITTAALHALLKKYPNLESDYVASPPW